MEIECGICQQGDMRAKVYQSQFRSIYTKTSCEATRGELLRGSGWQVRSKNIISAIKSSKKMKKLVQTLSSRPEDRWLKQRPCPTRRRSASKRTMKN